MDVTVFHFKFNGITWTFFILFLSRQKLSYTLHKTDFSSQTGLSRNFSLYWVFLDSIMIIPLSFWPIVLGPFWHLCLWAIRSCLHLNWFVHKSAGNNSWINRFETSCVHIKMQKANFIPLILIRMQNWEFETASEGWIMKVVSSWIRSTSPWVWTKWLLRNQSQTHRFQPNVNRG